MNIMQLYQLPRKSYTDRYLIVYTELMSLRGTVAFGVIFRFSSLESTPESALMERFDLMGNFFSKS